MRDPRPAAQMDAELAGRVRAVVLDVDGVMTDGGILIGATASGERIEMKRFHVEDGLGIHLLKEAGIVPIVVTGRESDAVRFRAEELGITECHQDREARKLDIVARLLERRGWRWEELAFLADDLPDLAVLRKVGLPAAVANAVPEVRAVARWVGHRPGGEGAVREFVEALLAARGGWRSHAEGYVTSRSGAR